MFYGPDDKVFYVYIHRCLSTSGVYYVGKGSKLRAWYPRKADYWRRLKEEGNLSVEIVRESITEAEAFVLEEATITTMRESGHPIVNVHKSGGGKVSNGLRRDILRGYMKKERILAFVDKHNRRPCRTSLERKERCLARSLEEFQSKGRPSYDERFAVVLQEHLRKAREYLSANKTELTQIKRSVREDKERRIRLAILQEISLSGRLPNSGPLITTFVSRYYPSGAIYDAAFAALCLNVRQTRKIPDEF